MYKTTTKMYTHKLFIVLFAELLCRELKHCLTGKHIISYLLMTLLYRNIKQQLSCSSINIIYLNYKRSTTVRQIYPQHRPLTHPPEDTNGPTLSWKVLTVQVK